MSSSLSSASSSRQSSPLPSSRQLSPRISSRLPSQFPTKQSNFKKFVNSGYFYLTLIPPIIIFLVYIANSKPFYCVNGLNHFCIKTPINGNCTGIRTVNCDEGYSKVGKYCIKVNQTKVDDVLMNEKIIKKQLSDNNKFSLQNDELTNVTLEYLKAKGEIKIDGEKIIYTPLPNHQFYLYLSITLFVIIISTKFVVRA